MKTIALKENTFQLLKDLKEKRKRNSFDDLIIEVILGEESISKSMIGCLKGKAKPFTQKERGDMWKERK